MSASFLQVARARAADARGGGHVHSDAIIVLGFLRRADCQPTQALCQRLDSAKSVYDQLVLEKGHGSTCMILTGGDPQNIGVTEARTMKEYLMAAGIPHRHIKEETQARYTIENGFLVRDLVDNLAELAGVHAAHLVSNEFHLERSRLIFEAAFARIEPHQRPITLRCVAAPDGSPATLLAETGKSLDEWRRAEEAQLLPSCAPAVVRKASCGVQPAGSVLMDRVRAHVDLIHAVRTFNADAFWQGRSATRFEGRVGRGGAGPLHYCTLYAASEVAAHEAEGLGRCVRFLRMLLEKGSDANATNDNGCTPLHFCALIADAPTRDAMNALLLPHMSEQAVASRGVSDLWSGAQTYDSLLARQVAGQTAPPPLPARDVSMAAFEPPQYAKLLAAVAADDLAAVQLWIHAHAADPSMPLRAAALAPVGGGSSALHYACSRGHRAIAELLLRRRADPNALNAFSSTPLHYAACMQHVGTVALLLSHGACASRSVRGESRLWDGPRTPEELAPALQWGQLVAEAEQHRALSL